jgi:hypothetical protein
VKALCERPSASTATQVGTGTFGSSMPWKLLTGRPNSQLPRLSNFKIDEGVVHEFMPGMPVAESISISTSSIAVGSIAETPWNGIPS